MRCASVTARVGGWIGVKVVDRFGLNLKEELGVAKVKAGGLVCGEKDIYVLG